LRVGLDGRDAGNRGNGRRSRDQRGEKLNHCRTHTLPLYEGEAGRPE
jgi:hypothetical protein